MCFKRCLYLLCEISLNWFQGVHFPISSPLTQREKPAKGVFFQDQTLQSVFKKRCAFLALRSEKGVKKE